MTHAEAIQSLKELRALVDTVLDGVVRGLEAQPAPEPTLAPAVSLSAFFDAYRDAFGKVKQEQVQPLEFLVTRLSESAASLREASYILATVKHETADTYQPVKEAYWVNDAEAWRKKNLRYWPWYGRGFVQLTWERNYKLAGQKLGMDLTTNPDAVMEPETSFKILLRGMREGWFTGKKLSDYTAYHDMRRVVNGMDKADQIAEYAEKFEDLLMQAGYV